MASSSVARCRRCLPKNAPRMRLSFRRRFHRRQLRRHPTARRRGTGDQSSGQPDEHRRNPDAAARSGSRSWALRLFRGQRRLGIAGFFCSRAAAAGSRSRDRPVLRRSDASGSGQRPAVRGAARGAAGDAGAPYRCRACAATADDQRQLDIDGQRDLPSRMCHIGRRLRCAASGRSPTAL